MRKISSFALALGFVLPLAGCPGDDTTGDGTTTSNMPTSTGPSSETDPADTDPADTDPPSTDTDPMSDTTMGGGNGGFCGHQCEADGDCTIDGMDIGLTCVENFCTGEDVEGCATDEECIATLSGWEAGMACTAGGGECEALMQVCLDVGGEGHCATAPSEFFACADAMFDEIETQDIDGNDVTVCGNANAACDEDGFCFSPCQSDDDCVSEAFPICNTDTGFCDCGENADCETIGDPAFSACGSDGSCGCGSDQNCIDGEVGDVCDADGFCGCTNDMACENVENSFDGGSIACLQ